MQKIIRTKTRAEGDITDAERDAMAKHVDLWVSRAFRTSPIEPDKIIPAIEGLYASAGLKKPRVVIVPSPLIMAFAYGASAAIWHERNKFSAYDATRDATRDATLSAADSAANSATFSATRDATRDATLSAADSAANSATFSATDSATRDATFSATNSATFNATRDATLSAADSAADSAANSATFSATRDATFSAILSATDSAILSTTFSAILSATRDATFIAILSATRDATRDATLSATRDATRDATLSAADIATDSATFSATDSATRDATFSATDSATRDATRDATFSATYDVEKGAENACFELAGDFGLKCAQHWARSYQGGNMWAGYECFLTACRDILGLDLPEHEAYENWEQAAIHGGFRVMHEEFCIVSDFPERILVDDQNRPHCENGPSHRWRDGWSFYHWHGVKIPAHWIEDKANLDPMEVLRTSNVEQRAAGMQILGARMIPALNPKILDGDPDSDMGALVEVTLDGFPETGYYLQAKCPRNGTIFEGVPKISDIDGLPINTALAAQAWRVGDPQSEYSHPTKRT